MAAAKLTSNQKLALVSGIGVAAMVGLALLLSSSTANAAPNATSTTPTLDPNSARGQAATALASAIQTAGGYCGTQKAAVIQYEQAAGLTVDAGYPGTNVMTSLRADLAAMGTTSSYPLIGTIATYPWTAAAGWASGNVPAAFADGSGTAWNAGTGCPGT
jgi:hypothetical protein